MFPRLMRFPEEIVVDQVLPTVRTALARVLSNQGWTEGRIATTLGLSQAAVSKYLRGKVVPTEPFASDNRLLATIDSIACGLADGSMDSFQAMGSILLLLRQMENRDIICKAHETAFPVLRGLGCDLCVRGIDSALLEEGEVLVSLRRALQRLVLLRGFPEAIPNVGSNLAMAKRTARTPLDVAAVPGRIYEMHGQVKIPAMPEFGASRHVAEVVLAVHSLIPRCRAALNIALRDSYIDTARKLGWSLREFDARYEGRQQHIARSLGKSKRPIDVLFHRGAFGIEPIMYVLGDDAGDIVDKVTRLLSP